MSATNSFGAATTRAATPGEPPAVDVAVPVITTNFVDSEIGPSNGKILLIICGVIAIVVVALAMIAAITCWLSRAVVSVDDGDQFDNWNDEFPDLKKVVPRKDADSTGSDQMHHIITMYDDEDYAHHGDSDSSYADDE